MFFFSCLALGIQSLKLRTVMEPQYHAFRETVRGDTKRSSFENMTGLIPRVYIYTCTVNLTVAWWFMLVMGAYRLHPLKKDYFT